MTEIRTNRNYKDTVFRMLFNEGNNPELLGACRQLKEYAQYVNKVRKFAKELPLAEAVEHAVDECIKKGILTDFLRKNRAEAIAMSIFEYDEEKHLKNEREFGYRNGHEDGKQEGIKLGIAQGKELGIAIGKSGAILDLLQ